jgi:hypothetical protein
MVWVDIICRVKSDNIDLLAENKIGTSRAAKNDKINLLYQLAVADLRQD